MRILTILLLFSSISHADSIYSKLYRIVYGSYYCGCIDNSNIKNAKKCKLKATKFADEAVK